VVDDLGDAPIVICNDYFTSERSAILRAILQFAGGRGNGFVDSRERKHPRNKSKIPLL
jgi:hypothetical protein